MRHEARQVPSWLIFDVGRKRSSDAKHSGRDAQFGRREVESTRWREVSVRALWVRLLPNFELDGIRSVRGERDSGV
jgi:hypothetical protein